MIKKIIISLIYKAIKFVEKIEYRNIKLDENNINKKIIDSIELKEKLLVESDTGLVPVTHVHLTQPYTHYDIVLENGLKLSCADIHILFDDNLNEIYAKDLKVGNFLSTINGISKVSSINKSNKKTSMCDLTIDHPNHRFYTNGILSHNTISSAIYILHFLIFNNDKNAMIIANKADTVIEIVDKIKSIYSLLPFFLKPGIKVWNQRSITLENGCRIKTSARTKSPAIGFTIDLLYLDEFAHIPSNIIEPFYTSAYPTVSAIKNSKIIITSTPNGMNLFHKLLTDSERPDGDPKKNTFSSMRVYWHQVPGRFVTYAKLNDHKMYEMKVTKEKVFEQVFDKFSSKTDIKMNFNLDTGKDIIHVDNNDSCSSDDVKSLRIKNRDGEEIPLAAVAELATWKEEAVKDIGSEDAFNQEYGLRFVNASKSVLDESTIDNILKSKKNYLFEEIEEFNKLNFSYEDLRWVEDDDIFLPIKRKDYKFILSVDLSEGLGQDYSIINIFKIGAKSKELIEDQKSKYKSLTDFFRLEQVGIFRSNVMSIKQMAELLYILVFEYLNPDNCKIVLELNNYGNTLLAEMPHVFDGRNKYGSSVFFRYKHRIDSEDQKIGLKVGNNKSNLLVKDYQDLMNSKSFYINEHITIKEITTFVKHITAAGNVRYAADGTGHDDTTMTIVNATSVFNKSEFKEMCDEWLSKHVNNELATYIRNSMKESEYIEAVDYSQVLSVRKKYISRKKGSGYNNGSWFGIK